MLSLSSGDSETHNLRNLNFISAQRILQKKRMVQQRWFIFFAICGLLCLAIMILNRWQICSINLTLIIFHKLFVRSFSISEPNVTKFDQLLIGLITLFFGFALMVGIGLLSSSSSTNIMRSHQNPSAQEKGPIISVFGTYPNQGSTFGLPAYQSNFGKESKQSFSASFPQSIELGKDSFGEFGVKLYPSSQYPSQILPPNEYGSEATPSFPVHSSFHMESFGQDFTPGGSFSQLPSSKSEPEVDSPPFSLLEENSLGSVDDFASFEDLKYSKRSVASVSTSNSLPTPESSLKTQKVLKNLKLDSHLVYQWTNSLKKWISNHVIQPLASSYSQVKLFEANLAKYKSENNIPNNTAMINAKFASKSLTWL